MKAVEGDGRRARQGPADLTLELAGWKGFTSNESLRKTFQAERAAGEGLRTRGSCFLKQDHQVRGDQQAQSGHTRSLRSAALRNPICNSDQWETLFSPVTLLKAQYCHPGKRILICPLEARAISSSLLEQRCCLRICHSTADGRESCGSIRSSSETIMHFYWSPWRRSNTSTVPFMPYL